MPKEALTFENLTKVVVFAVMLWVGTSVTATGKDVVQLQTQLAGLKHVFDKVEERQRDHESKGWHSGAGRNLATNEERISDNTARILELERLNRAYGEKLHEMDKKLDILVAKAGGK